MYAEPLPNDLTVEDIYEGMRRFVTPHNTVKMIQIRRPRLSGFDTCVEWNVSQATYHYVKNLGHNSKIVQNVGEILDTCMDAVFSNVSLRNRLFIVIDSPLDLDKVDLLSELILGEQFNQLSNLSVYRVKNEGAKRGKAYVDQKDGIANIYLSEKKLLNTMGPGLFKEALRGKHIVKQRLFSRVV